MANGDLTFKTLYSAALGGGRDANGTPKQSKRFVVGEINGEYLLAGMKVHPHGGPQAFGVNNLDYLFMEVIECGTLVTPDSEKLPHASYDHANKLIFVVEDLGQTTPAVPTNGDTIVIRFVAIGDDPTTPELG
jgi:hypothetical protein